MVNASGNTEFKPFSASALNIAVADEKHANGFFFHIFLHIKALFLINYDKISGYSFLGKLQYSVAKQGCVFHS